MTSPQPQPQPGPSNSQPTATASSSGAGTPISRSTTTAKLPPLTTPWNTPLSCTWTYVVDHPDETASPGAVAFLDLEPMPGDKTLSCYPNNMFAHGRTGVFSPGICPGGWTTATVSTEDSATTTAICCSYGYTLSESVCRRSVATALAVPITYNTTAGTYNVLTRSTTTLYSAALAVSTIQVLFGDEDKRRLGIHSERKDPDYSMPMRTRIGIAVGVCAFVLLCLGLVYLIVARRRRLREGLTKERLMRDLKSMHQQQTSEHNPCHSILSQSTISSGPDVTSLQRQQPLA